MFYVIFPQVHEARPKNVRLRDLLVFVHHIHLRKVKAMGIATPVAIILVIQSMRWVFRTHLARLHQHLVSGPTCAGTPQAWDNRKTPARLPAFFYFFLLFPDVTSLKTGYRWPPNCIQSRGSNCARSTCHFDRNRSWGRAVSTVVTTTAEAFSHCFDVLI